MRFFAFTLLFVAVAAGVLSAQPQTAYNTTLFDTLDPATGSGRYSGLWGYTAPDGREYALLGGYLGTYIIDITEKPIRLVASIAGAPNGWREIKTYRQYAYVVSEGGGGVQIIDLSQLPDTATLARAETAFFNTAHTVSIEGDYLYINGTKADAAANGGSIIFDLSQDPLHPRLVGKWTERYVHDAIIYNDTMYAAAINDGRLDIIDLHDRTNPTLISSITYPGAGTHNSDLTADHRYVMTTDEVGGTPKTLKIWDLADLGDIRKVADYTAAPDAIIHQVHTLGTLAVISWYTAGTRIVDISDPTRPVMLGYFDTYPGTGQIFAGNWETYPYFASGRMIASDMQTGLHVFTFDGAEKGEVRGVVLNRVTREPIAGATVTLGAIGWSARTDSLGRFVYRGAVDTLEVRAEAFPYITGTGELPITSMATGGTEVEIELQPLPIASFTIRGIDAETGEDVGPLAWRIAERPELAAIPANPLALSLPQDSLFHLNVGAWGYRPTRITLTALEGDYVVQLHPGYIDDFEADLGWRAGALDDALSGTWERGLPVETTLGPVVIQPGFQTTPGGKVAWFTGLAGGAAGGVGANDVDDGTTTLMSPSFDVADSSDPWINLSYWYSRDGNAAAIDDTLEFYLSGDDGENWKRVAAITASERRWVRWKLAIRDRMTPTSTMRFRIVASDRGDPSLVEAGFDDFVISNGGEAPVIGDSLRLPEMVGGVPSASRLVDAGSILVPSPLRGEGELTIRTASPLRGVRVDLADAAGRIVAALYRGDIGPEGAVIAVDVTALPAGAYRWVLRGEEGMISGPVIVLR